MRRGRRTADAQLRRGPAALLPKSEVRLVFSALDGSATVLRPRKTRAETWSSGTSSVKHVSCSASSDNVRALSVECQLLDQTPVYALDICTDRRSSAGRPAPSGCAWPHAHVSEEHGDH